MLLSMCVPTVASPVKEYLFKIKKNPYWPFRRIVDNVYIMSKIRGNKTVILFVGTVVFFYFLLKALINIDEADPITTICYLVGWIVSAMGLLYEKQEKKLVINHPEKCYCIYKAKKVVYKGSLHEVYIRLKRQDPSGGVPFYYLAVNAFKLEEQRITGLSTDEDQMRCLGRRLSSQVQLNYFDYEDKSEQHKIRFQSQTILNVSETQGAMATSALAQASSPI